MKIAVSNFQYSNFISFRQKPKSGVSGSYGSSILKLTVLYCIFEKST